MSAERVRPSAGAGAKYSLGGDYFKDTASSDEIRASVRARLVDPEGARRRLERRRRRVLRNTAVRRDGEVRQFERPATYGMTAAQRLAYGLHLMNAAGWDRWEVQARIVSPREAA